MILIRIADLKNWQPLSKTRKFDVLLETLSPPEIVMMEEAFADYICRLLISDIDTAIRTQRFPVRYAPLSRDYVALKRRKRRKRGFWQSTEYLRKAITYWRDPVGEFWAIGVDPNETHPDNGQSVEMIIKSLEEGVPENNLPARPLFTPLARRISKSISPRFLSFLRVYNKDYYKLVRK